MTTAKAHAQDAGEIPVQDFHESAVLLAAGFPFLRGEPASHRVTLVFGARNPKGETAEDVLTAHNGGQFRVSSLALVQGLDFAKNRIFATRRAAGMERP